MLNQNPANIVVDINEQIPLETIAPDGRIGMVALATDYNIEQDLRRMLPLSVEMFTNRVINFNPLTSENLLAMADDISRAAGGILPGRGVDVAIYGCTSGTALIGLDRVTALIQQSLPGVKVTTPLLAAAEGLRKLDVKRVSVLTPYDRQINEGLVSALNELDIEISNLAGLGFNNDFDITGVPADEIVRLGTKYADRDADALFVSCTSFRASLAIERLEQALSMPVVASNPALAWHALHLLDYRKPVTGFGSLLAGLGTD